MATFERCTDNQSGTDTIQHTKYPLRRLEPSIQKFLKVIQIDLGRLHRHRLNVEKFNRLQDLNSLNTEQINATRTVQQIKANIHEIEKTRLQVCDEDMEKFDNRINDMKLGAIKSVYEFVDLAKGCKSSATYSSSDSSPDGDPQLLTFDSSNDRFEDQLQMKELPENTEVAESWDNLQENLQELNSLIHQFTATVNTQQESVDRIQDNVEEACTNVREGAKQLGKAAKYKVAVLPIAGAVLGTVVAGPFGLIAGAKIGGLIGVAGGGAVGYLGGRIFKKRHEKATEMELAKLSRSNSLPDVHSRSVDGNSWGRERNLSTTEVQGTNSK